MPTRKLVIKCKHCSGWDNYDVRTNGQNSYLEHHKMGCPAMQTKAPTKKR